MSWDNLIRQANQRLTRLAKLAGRESTALSAVTNRIESIVNSENIYNFYKNKYEREHPPKTAKEIKSLYKNADKYAREKANVMAIEIRTFPNGEKMPMLVRTSKLSEFWARFGKSIVEQIPTTGQLRKILAEQGKQATKETVNEIFEMLSDFDELMKMYHVMTNKQAYAEIKDIRQRAKDEGRRPTYAEMDEMLSIYNGG